MDSDDELVITHDDADVLLPPQEGPVQYTIRQTVAADPNDDMQVTETVSKIWMTRKARRANQRPETDAANVMDDINDYLADAPAQTTTTEAEAAVIMSIIELLMYHRPSIRLL